MVYLMNLASRDLLPTILVKLELIPSGLKEISLVFTLEMVEIKKRYLTLNNGEQLNGPVWKLHSMVAGIW